MAYDWQGLRRQWHKGGFKLRTNDLPVSHGMLVATQTELKSEITTLRLEMKAGFQKVDHQIKEMKSTLEHQLQEMKTMIYRQTALMEEQKDKNNFVMDQYNFMAHRQDSLDNRVTDIEKTIEVFKK